MKPLPAGPDTLLAGRYRLERECDDRHAGTLWRGQDEILARTVAVRVLPDDDPRAARLLAAAARAGQLTDPRCTQIYDAAREAGLSYVVGEWVDGESLRSALTGGPLRPERATALLGEVADALAGAHRAGLAHRRLGLDEVILGDDGGVKLRGLEVAAALAGLPDDPDPQVRARLDVQGLGCLLYAALTARWPGGPGSGLPPAPYSEGRLCSPRQVRAGVPRALDGLVDRCLSDRPRRGAIPIAGPAELAGALAALPQERGAAGDPGEFGDFGDPGPAGPPSRTRRWVGRTVPLAVLAGVGVGGWLLGLAVGEVPGTKPRFPALTQSTGGPAAQAAAHATLPIPAGAVRDFDPEGDGQENPDQVPLAYDGDPSTAWQTSRYRGRPDFGGLKPGAGLLVDLGSPQEVGSVTLALTLPGADVELRAAMTPGTSETGYRLVARAVGSKDTVQLTPPGGPLTARYLLVWLTRLPADGGGYREGIAEIVVRR